MLKVSITDISPCRGQALKETSKRKKRKEKLFDKVANLFFKNSRRELLGKAWEIEASRFSSVWKEPVDKMSRDILMNDAVVLKVCFIIQWQLGNIMMVTDSHVHQVAVTGSPAVDGRLSGSPPAMTEVKGEVRGWTSRMRSEEQYNDRDEQIKIAKVIQSKWCILAIGSPAEC